MNFARTILSSRFPKTLRKVKLRWKFFHRNSNCVSRGSSSVFETQAELSLPSLFFRARARVLPFAERASVGAGGVQGRYLVYIRGLRQGIYERYFHPTRLNRLGFLQQVQLTPCLDSSYYNDLDLDCYSLLQYHAEVRLEAANLATLAHLMPT